MPAIKDASVKAAFELFPAAAGKRLKDVRELIFKVAKETQNAGAIEETLKWGQPSYLTKSPKSGSTIRLGLPKGRDDAVAVFLHCQTNLVETFREIYPKSFEFEGNRAVIMPLDQPLPESELGHCIALALTYHSRKRT